MKLTIGMAHYDDYDGAYFSIQSIRKELVFSGNQDLLSKIEFVVVDNNPNSNHGKILKRFLQNNLISTNDIRYVESAGNAGTSLSRNKVVETATGDFCLIMDCHVMLCPVVSVIKNLFQFMDKNPKNPKDNNIYSGPMIYDDMKSFTTHFNLNWSGGMLGQWGNAWYCHCGEPFSVFGRAGSVQYVSLVSQRKTLKCVQCNVVYPNIKQFGHKKILKSLGYKKHGLANSEPFEIPAQGLGTFFVRRESWLGFNEHARGFGGEEWYIHEKYRQAGHKAVCLPFLRWLHRFNRPNNVPYPLNNLDKCRNYILEFSELGLSVEPVLKHFIQDIQLPEEKIRSFVHEANSIYKR